MSYFRYEIKKRAFTLVEMLVVISIIAILASLLMPALQESLAASRKIFCANNLKQIGLGCSAYLDDNHNFYPSGYSDAIRWCEKNSPFAVYLGYGADTPDSEYYYWNSPTVLNCPASLFESPSKKKYYCDYGGNKGIFRVKSSPPPYRRMAEVPTPAQKVLFIDFLKMGKPSTDGGYGPLFTGWEYRITNTNHQYIWTDRHSGQFNILWADYHVTGRVMGDLEDKANFRTGDMSN